MSKKPYTIHGSVKGKHVFQEDPVAQVWADNPEQAEEMGRQITRNHPIYNQHFGDNFKAEKLKDDE